ncbi:hypothetical protein T459_04580 [Capsicum annuum]|uniref:EF-hand domain-containing protein n=1 Tax=Capsicum annuum TaxID=4072 RepID=A0A1U8FRQ2_CAPAN|nr:putative Multidrug resistance pump [Capsicum annuum]PHT89467.1 hypothetical protein T459_04580 [Capsicum annuum]
MSNSTTSFLYFRYNNFRTSLSKSRRSFNLSKLKQTPSPTSLAHFHPKLEEMKKVFDKFDTNKDGKITKEEYKSAMKMMGSGGGNRKSYEVGDAFQAADTNGDGFISFEEFMRAQNLEGGVNSTDIKSAFMAFDLDGDGKISAEELLHVQQMLGEKCSLESCKKMVRGVDANGDGLIDMDEFVTMMTRTMKLV